MAKIAVLGYGTVGSGVVEVLNTNGASIAKRAGDTIEVKSVLDLRDFPGDPIQEKIVHDIDLIINDPEIEVVVEVMGGVEPAFTFVKKALEAGKSVCTSNKALVAAHGPELLEMAKERRLNFMFEASVGGGIPIIRPLNQSLTADEITKITGILNGTTNYILTKMSREGISYQEVLKEAQALGYAEKNPEADVEGYDACAEKSAKIRKAEEKAKTNMLTKQKFSIDSNGKLANCESKNPEECEVFIVEGDSAGGSAKTARNRRTQAILPIRGKILNVEKASIDKVLANAEIKTMINSFNCGFLEGYGNDFDISRLRYNKIIIMTDAEVEGEHIDPLLLTFFYRFMPELINQGHVYIATPPLYKVVPKKGEGEYLYDDKALEDYRKKHTSGTFTLQRYKGLGEMDPDQLWETTLNPETRILKQVEIEDARLATEVTAMLMGTDVPPRRKFIYTHANEAEIDA